MKRDYLKSANRASEIVPFWKKKGDHLTQMMGVGARHRLSSEFEVPEDRQQREVNLVPIL